MSKNIDDIGTSFGKYMLTGDYFLLEISLLRVVLRVLILNSFIWQNII